MTLSVRYWIWTLLAGLVAVPVLISILATAVTVAGAGSDGDHFSLWAAGCGALVAAVWWFLWPRRRNRPDEWAAAMVPVVIPPLYYVAAWALVFQLNGLAYGPSWTTAEFTHMPYGVFLLWLGFRGLLQPFPVLLVTVLVVSPLAYLAGSAASRPIRSGRRWLVAMLAMSLVVAAIGSAQVLVVKARTDLLASGTKVSQEVDLEQYRPFSKGNRLVVPTTKPMLRITGDYPVLDGATAAYPIYAAMGQAIYQLPSGLDEDGRSSFADRYLDCTNTANGYQRLIDGDVDVFFGAQPSAKQQAAAKAAGKELKLTPIGREAFVLFVNQDNPVSGVSTQQVRDIYTRKITNWKQAGGLDEERRGVSAARGLG